MQIDKAIEGLKQLATCNPAGFVAHTSLFYSADLSASGFHVSIFKWSSGPPARYHVYCTVVGSPAAPSRCPVRVTTSPGHPRRVLYRSGWLRSHS